MPSPIAHSMVGYVISRIATRKVSPENLAWNRPSSLFLVVAILSSLLPDIDTIAGLLAKDLGRYHNNGTHSLVVGLGVALFAGFIAFILDRRHYKKWFFIVLTGYELHILMDFFTYDSRGLMFFWPFMSERYASELVLFYGVRWSEGWIAIEHLITLMTELVFIATIFGLLSGFSRIRNRKVTGGYRGVIARNR